MANVVVVGSGTDVGKTFVSAHVGHALTTRMARRVGVLKPIMTGFDPQNNDAKTLMESVNYPYTPEGLNKVSPWRSKEPVAPALVDFGVTFEQCFDFCMDAFVSSSPILDLILETPGGIMSPIFPGKTTLDLVRALDRKLKLFKVFVTSVYLGSISHALTALSVLKCDLLVLNNPLRSDQANDTLSLLQHHVNIPIFVMPYAKHYSFDSEMPELCLG